MSASQQKKRRQNAAAPTPAPETKSGRGPWIAAGIGVGVLVLLAIFFAVLNTGVIHRNVTAATAGSHKITPVMYNYYYQDVAYQNSVSYLTDPNTSLRNQYYDATNGVTWADYLTEQTNTLISQTLAVADEAQAQGYTISEEDLATVDEQIANLELSAASSGYSIDAYLSQAIGTGSTLETYREYMELRAMTIAYQTAHAESLTYTPEEVAAYHEEHRDELDTVSYRTYICSVDGTETDENGNAVIDATASEALAREIAETTEGDEAAFAAAVSEAAGEDNTYYQDEDATLVRNVTLDTLPEACADWLRDESRQYGDTTVYANDSGAWTVVMFVDNWTKYDVDVVDVRHILIEADTSDESALEEANTQAQEILDEYLAGDQTEEAFAALAQEHSADTSASDGGLIANIYPGQTVANFDAWCFDPDRQSGDTGIVETEYGVHILYFVGPGEAGNAADYRTTLAMQASDTEDWVTALGESLPVENKGFGMFFTALR